MIVTFISQCEKKALLKTRRILDAFANRIGNNTWQTFITAEGLFAVKKLLNKTASKNTAVACHYIKSNKRTELKWIVGKREAFNHQGIVPVNSTYVNGPVRDDRNSWHYLSLIQALTALAALFHDWGKANARFQQKLAKNYKGKQGDALRHEWVSCLLLKAFISTFDDKTDKGWLMALATGDIDEAMLVNMPLKSIEKPLTDLPPAARIIAWLVVSHHRLPVLFGDVAKNEYKKEPAATIEDLLYHIDRTWGYENKSASKTLSDCFSFPQGLLTESTRWLSQLKKWANKLIKLLPQVERIIADGSFRAILHHARLSLMLGDHFYSSLDKDADWKGGSSLIANTTKQKNPKQALDQHLTGVCKSALAIAYKLPDFERYALYSYNTKALRKKSPPSFSWQDKAVEKIKQWNQEKSDDKHGFFAVNMASTGCGKTFANAKIMRQLSKDGDSLRYILALGLRTLTLQTGDEYREKIFSQGNGEDLAVMIGSRAVKALHDQKDDDNFVGNNGSQSQEALLAEHDNVIWESPLPEDKLITVLKSEKDKKLLYAPVLVCTIDHIMAATETIRGGRYILPCLRLMTSDLVIDEVDNFTGADAIAIGRLIHLAGMLGRKVMISSATIPPALAKGYFNAYREGWQLYSQTCDAKPAIGCAWIDEFNTTVVNNQGESSQNRNNKYSDNHDAFIKKRINHLKKQPARRKGNIVDCKQIFNNQQGLSNNYVLDCSTILSLQQSWFHIIQQQTLIKHIHNHDIDNQTGISVSFGVIRMANISPCIELTRYLMNANWPSDTEVRVMAYHSQQVLLLRDAQEKHLDAILKRKEKAGQPPVAFANRCIRKHLDEQASCNKNIKQLLFILVATPVEETGRDHDFDWGILEPSSFCSIIQMSGRVRRHRSGEISHPNIGILQYNWKTVKHQNKPGKPYFTRPGYECKAIMINDHDINKLVDVNALSKRIDAVARISENQPNNDLATLEHKIIEHWLNNTTNEGPESLQGYLTQQWYLTALPQVFNRFRHSENTFLLYLIKETEDDYVFGERDEKGNLLKDDVYGDIANQADRYNIKLYELTTKENQRLWLYRDYVDLIRQQAETDDISQTRASLIYGELALRESSREKLKLYNDQLGIFHAPFNPS